jgi:hypothetical protein
MATEALYRISSGEVYSISTVDGSFSEETNEFRGVAINPTLVDGSQCQAPNGDFRVFGYAKIKDGATIRNATQVEIDTFAPARTDDRNQRQADKTIEYLQNDPKMRRIIIALTDVFITYEFNKYRKWFQAFETQMALATSLANLQTRMAAFTAANPMPDRTLSQLSTALENRISKDD